MDFLIFFCVTCSSQVTAAAALTGVSVVSVPPHQQFLAVLSELLGLWFPSGRPASQQANISEPCSRPKAPELYVFWLRCLPVVGFLLIGSSAESPGRLVLAMPRGSAAHRFVWAAGWHAVPRVLIWCQLFSILPYPQSYFVPQLVYTRHPLTESKKIRESLC